MTCILTTHSQNHPLLQALSELNVRIIYKDFRHITHKDLKGTTAYLSNLFTELKYPYHLYKLSKALKSRKIPYVFWNRDAPWNCGMKSRHRWVLNIINPIDIYFTHSGQENIPAKVTKYLPNAARVDYIFNGDMNIFRNESHYSYDVCFMGALANKKRFGCRDRHDFLSTLQQQLQNSSPRLRFKIVDTSVERLSLTEQLDLIQRSKININYGANCDLPNLRSWGLPERVFGIPASGAFLLTEHRECLRDTFSIDTYDYFSSPEECVEKIIFYLCNLDILRSRAETLHNNVVAKHTYINRAQAFLEKLSN
ncbi:MAG: glycosyltransferase [Thiothrix sp.]|uniref:glycosyltransferase family protein n=1 Tax=Thiothrix sp. TaxID=1032 RepID=UPI00260C2245|nr:glycosyltransferase [Thiothrix sp.]MDD5394641.1 glycosyltransferase [Thiothrix sp.]